MVKVLIEELGNLNLIHNFAMHFRCDLSQWLSFVKPQLLKMSLYI